MIELRFALQPKQKQLLEAMERVPILFYGGAKGGGKSRGMRDVFLIRRFKYPGTTCGIFRKTYPELEANHIEPLFRDHPSLRPYYNDSKKTLSLPNGSTMYFRYAENDKDLDRYQGAEYDDLGIEEAGQWEEALFRKLHGSNRTAKPGIKARCLLTGNPGGIGHGWLKRLFVERRFHKNERPSDYDFIQAKVYDNAALMQNDPDYVHKLEANPNQALRKAYLDGDWDIFAGQFFQEISRDVHFIKPFGIPPHWNRFGAYDFGFNHPAAFGWFANDEDGNTYLYRELVRAGLRVDQFAAELLKYDDSKLLYPIVAGHDCWAKRTNLIKSDQPDPPTIAEEFASHGLHLKPAVIDRKAGAAHLRSYLAWQGKPNNRPRFYIFNTCPITFDCLGRMIHDEDDVEDVLKVDATEGDPLSGDDPYDMVRYGLMSRPAITDPIVAKHPIGSKGWYEEQNRIDWERERERMLDETQGGWAEQPPFS
jgi:phage terminase large subunit